MRNSSSKQISSKKIPLVKGLPKYLIQDSLQFPLLADFNPIQIYKTLDNNPQIGNNLKKVHLAPSCKGGLLSVDYIMRVELNFDSILSTDEKMRMPLDFYVPFDINSNKNKIIQNLNNISLS